MSKSTKKSTKRAYEEDPFAAALCAVDKVRTKVAKRQRESTFFAQVERSLANSVRAAVDEVSTKPPLPSNLAAASDAGILKSRSISHKVYAGRRKLQPFNGVVPRLFDICMRFCINNIDNIEETGDIPFYVLQPILEKCSHTQLARLESKNPYLEEDTDYLWEKHCNNIFPTEEEGSDKSWKHCFFRLTYEREDRLKRLSAKIGANKREVVQPQRKAMLADPIAPRDARRRQVKNGTIVHSSAVPSAADLSRSRRQIFETGTADALKKVYPVIRNQGRVNDAAHSSSSCPSSSGGVSSSASKSMGAIFAVSKKAPQKGALMVKTLKMMKARRR